MRRELLACFFLRACERSNVPASARRVRTRLLPSNPVLPVKCDTFRHILLQRFVITNSSCYLDRLTIVIPDSNCYPDFMKKKRQQVALSRTEARPRRVNVWCMQHGPSCAPRSDRRLRARHAQAAAILKARSIRTFRAKKTFFWN